MALTGTALTTKEDTPMELHEIPLDHLTVARINARTHGATEPLDTLAASIRAQGVLQPLLVRPVAGGDHFEIVAGQRRYLACRRIAQDAPVEPLPCFVLAATDDASAHCSRSTWGCAGSRTRPFATC